MQKKTVVILQPNYIPWWGYFDLMNRADIFVLYDDVQYTKNDWRNRNKIKTPTGWQWLIIPVSYEFGELIDNVKVLDNGWQKKHLKTLEMNYKKAPHFKEIYKIAKEALVWADDAMEYELNPYLWASIEDIAIYLDFKTDIKRSSIWFKDIGGNPTERLVGICKELEATEYLSGQAAKDYLEVEKFGNIKVTWHEYHPPVYKQLWGNFIPGLSIIDMLFNEGKDARRFFERGGSSVG